jgi:hypothetical protein
MSLYTRAGHDIRLTGTAVNLARMGMAALNGVGSSVDNSITLADLGITQTQLDDFAGGIRVGGNAVNPNLSGNMTVNEFMGALSGVGVNMSFNRLTGRFVVESAETGYNNRISLGDDYADVLGVFGFANMSDNSLADYTRTATATDARVTINGTDTITRGNNTLTFNNIAVTLGADAGGGGNNVHTIQVARDTLCARI